MSKGLDFTGRWVTRSSLQVQVTLGAGGFWTDGKRSWDQGGNYPADPQYDLMERVVDETGYAFDHSLKPKGRDAARVTR